ncbi:hypothetical protein ES288_D06G115100v1 [Gossypium darwinii]|uniref:Uncharacterized protein n=1 Tax=Gossypium darwinii TaxID=34276 RepID=A0A5D2C4J7_GOSDA|nr:hypothetical protein ES288_D06G115100v1 [Gossypium darwinii]
MSTETKANLVKMKPSGQDGSSKGKFDAAMNKRKLESSSKQPVGAKQKSATTKAEVKSKTSSSSSKTSTSSSKTSTTTKAKVREKKREPLRIFYESLSKQIPKSEMAEFCIYLMFCKLLSSTLGHLRWKFLSFYVMLHCFLAIMTITAQCGFFGLIRTKTTICRK